jgi:hypothetical protein
MNALRQPLVLYSRLRDCSRAAAREDSPALYAALTDLGRYAGWSLDRLRAHQRYLAAWLDQMVREGDQPRADQLVTQLAAAERVLREAAPGGLTLQEVVRVRAVAGDVALEIATDVVMACPTRQRRHWEMVLLIAQKYGG